MKQQNNQADVISDSKELLKYLLSLFPKQFIIIAKYCFKNCQKIMQNFWNIFRNAAQTVRKTFPANVQETGLIFRCRML